MLSVLTDSLKSWFKIKMNCVGRDKNLERLWKNDKSCLNKMVICKIKISGDLLFGVTIKIPAIIIIVEIIIIKIILQDIQFLPIKNDKFGQH